MSESKISRVLSTFLLLQISFSIIITSAAVSVNNGKQKLYTDFKVLRTTPLQNVGDISQLMELDGLEGIDISFWKYPTLLNQSADIMVSPRTFHLVGVKLERMGLKYKVILEDVQDLIDKQNDVFINGRRQKQAVATMSWTQYHRYNVIMNYCRHEANRNNKVRYQSIGKSTEGREIGLVTITSGGGGSKPAIWMDGGIHAREWVSPATVTFIMNSLLYDDNYSDLVENFDFYIVPIINVDGYEYTHTTDRMWRKTRNRNGGHRCIGVDPNRNFAYKWGGPGTSNNPCSDIYRGRRPFSEPETAAVANAVMERKEQLKMYLTFHSYSQLWLVPWSHTRYEKPEDYSELKSLADTGAEALASVHGTKYRVGTAPDILYEAAGGSDDWAKSTGIKYSYTLELRDKGRYGFALPASQIIPTGQETMEGVAAAARSLHEKTIP